MVWWCDKHSQHSCDDICWQCEQEHDQPYIDAFNAGWEARHELYSKEDFEKKKKEHLEIWKSDNKPLLHVKLRGSHDL
jgi:hypothetical protein